MDETDPQRELYETPRPGPESVLERALNAARRVIAEADSRVAATGATKAGARFRQRDAIDLRDADPVDDPLRRITGLERDLLTRQVDFLTSIETALRSTDRKDESMRIGSPDDPTLEIVTSQTDTLVLGGARRHRLLPMHRWERTAVLFGGILLTILYAAVFLASA